MAARTACEEELNTPPHRRVLVDTGANAAIRPYNHQWWNDMAHGVAPSKKVSMKLARNVADYGYMTKYGEVMMKSGARGDESDIGWILPVPRIQDELGMQALYKADGTAVLISPSGQELALKKHQGLTVLDGEIFDEIRAQLRKSHVDGRASLAGKQEESPMRTSARCNQVVCSGVQMMTQSTQTDDCELFQKNGTLGLRTRLWRLIL